MPLRWDDITRRDFVARAIAGGTAIVAAGGLRLAAPEAATAAEPTAADGALQAFADTMVPGRAATRTDLGLPIHPEAILGLHDEPGAVEADSLAVGRHPQIGFSVLEPAFLAELEARSLPLGGPFLALDAERRIQVCLGGLDFDNPTRTLWELAAAVPFAAFCAAAVAPAQTAARASGYRVMGYPGEAPAGYKRASYRRTLSRSRTKTGNLR